jgi:hypothetical protein
MDFQLSPGPPVTPQAQITLRPSGPVKVDIRWKGEPGR